MRVVRDGVYAIRDDFEISGEGSSEFIFARGWLLEIVKLDAGDYWFFQTTSRYVPMGRDSACSIRPSLSSVHSRGR